MALPPNEKVKVRDQLYKNIEFIDTFSIENPFAFSSGEVEIVQNWKHYIRGQFYLFRHLKKYSIFLNSVSPPMAYGVLSISDSLKDLFPFVPVMVETILLPFKNQIIYDGYIGAFNISFGGGIRSSFKDSYNEAKTAHGIIETLPFEPKSNRQTDEDKLKYYLKSERNRDYHWGEIQELIEKDPKLMVTYHQEMGKVNARTYGKRLHEMGLNNAWFGILNGIIIASGISKENLEQNLKGIVPSYKKEYVYLYQLKPKTKK